MPRIDPYIGCCFGNYEILFCIARGTYGWVYLARHKYTHHRVAIKILADVFLSNDRERIRFLKEAFILELLHHPHILTILEVGIQDDVPFMVTAYAPQGTLRDWLVRRSYRPFPEQLAVSILLEIGAALHYTHRRNILHHDLKPANILFNQNYEALLADFGIAIVRATLMQQRPTAFLGTSPYMAPEQFRGMVGYHSDQYAMGCIAYEMLTGRTPFIASNSQEMGYQHVHNQPLPLSYFNPHISHHIEQAILKSLEKDSANRHPNIAAFMKALHVPLLKDPIHSPSVQRRKQRNDFNLYMKELSDFSQVIQHDPANPIHYYNLSHILKQMGWDEEAHRAYIKAMELDKMNRA
jgi:serine/threonine protein kinase